MQVRAARWLFVVVLLGGAACHEESGIAVKSLNFDGNAAFDDARLKAVLATKQSGWLPWSPKHYFDRSEFEADAKRLQAFYADRGYPHARVAGVDVKLNDKKDAVDLTIRIDEGTPVIVDAVQFEGFEELDAATRGLLAGAPLKAGQPHDADNVRATRDLGARLLRDNGYPNAAVEVVEHPGADANHLTLTVRADPGPKATFGEIGIAGLKSVGERVVRRELTFTQGDLYRERELTKSQQRLVELGLFQFAHIGPVRNNTEQTQIPMRVTLAEGKPRELRLSGGYGSEERLRGSAQWNHLNFLGGARHATGEAKWSGIDRGAKFSFVEPYFLRRGLSLNLTGTAWHTSQLSYETGTYGGRLTAVYHFDSGPAGPREPVHNEVRVGLINEYLRYGITDSLGDLSLRQERISLGLNPDTGRSAGTLGAVDIDVERIAVDDSMNPHRGTISTFHFQDAARVLHGTYHFQEVLAEGRGFLPFGKSIVWANRARVGTIFAQSVNDMPFSARYFLGGSTSVRGWGRFEISPLDPQGLPIGGRSLVELSSEVRFPVRGNLRGVAFVDAGTVAAESGTFGLGDLRYAVGPGLRYLTPIGPVRVDFGIQVNQVPSLLINGVPERRHWRLHFSIGQAF
jgi:outer membrane protein assembly complex protein YaeT